MLLKHFQVFFNIVGKKIICSFFPARHTRNFPARKIKLVGFPASCKMSNQQAEERQFSTSTSKWAWQKASNRPFSGEGRTVHLTFLSFPTKLCINSKTKPSAVTNFPASSSEILLFCQPARFLWGTDKVRNRFVGCP